MTLVMPLTKANCLPRVPSYPYTPLPESCHSGLSLALRDITVEGSTLMLDSGIYHQLIAFLLGLTEDDTTGFGCAIHRKNIADSGGQRRPVKRDNRSS